MKVAALTGPSGVGKTTLLETLIRGFVAEGASVGAIKHTHHPLGEEDRGDTKRFRDAGADPVVLAGNGEAVVAGRRVGYDDPSELLTLFATDIVLIEGFKSFQGWPRIEVTGQLTAGEVARILDRIWRQ